MVALAAATGRPEGLLIDTHIHLFAADQARFPYHRDAVYRPPASPLEDYIRFAREARLDHAVIVHPEPYQDDHRYIEHCFANEPSPGFFKGTCLFDPISPRTPASIEALIKRNRGRIVALRIHATRKSGEPPTTAGAIRDRDLRSPAMKTTWRAVHDQGLAIQAHITPNHARDLAALAAEFRDTPVVIDHFARAGQGDPAHYADVLGMAKLPRVYMKFSGLEYSSSQGYPYKDLKPLVRRTYDAFGPGRMIWGGFGMNMADFQKNVIVFEELLDFASESDRARIRGINAALLFGFTR